MKYLVLAFSCFLGCLVHTDADAAADSDIQKAMAAVSASEYETAFQIFLELAGQGDALAQAHLGYMYQVGEGVKRDLTQSVRWYRHAAEQGNRDAQYNLGVAYFFGEGVQSDLALANFWYRKAAEQAQLPAQFSLGLSYQRGEGVAKDLVQAREWFERAGTGGYVRAQLQLARHYDAGSDEVPDYAKAAKWYRAAAEQGNADAQYRLGELYLEGQGVPENRDEARDWFAQALQNQHPDASQALIEIDIGNIASSRKGDDAGEATLPMPQSITRGEPPPPSPPVAQSKNAPPDGERNEPGDAYIPAAFDPDTPAPAAETVQPSSTIVPVTLDEDDGYGDDAGETTSPMPQSITRGEPPPPPSPSVAKSGNAPSQSERNQPTDAYIQTPVEDTGVPVDTVGEAADEDFMGETFERLFDTHTATRSADTPALNEAKQQGQSREQALSRLSRLAEQGDSEAQYRLGEQYLSSQSAQPDPALASHWFALAADQGHRPARKALETLQNQTPSLRRLGNGLSGTTVSWAVDPSYLGVPESALKTYQQGMAYAHGRGVRQSNEAAFAEYLKSAQQGYPPAQYQVGLAYVYGEGVAPDQGQAAMWYTRAASRGYGLAQRNLANMYRQGAEGIPRDLVQAHAWYSVLAKAGNPQDASQRDTLRHQLTEQQAQQSTTLAKEILATLSP